MNFEDYLLPLNEAQLRAERRREMLDVVVFGTLGAAPYFLLAILILLVA